MVPQTLVENIVVIAVEVIGVLFFGLLISSIRSVACLCSCWIRHSLVSRGPAAAACGHPSRQTVEPGKQTPMAPQQLLVAILPNRKQGVVRRAQAQAASFTPALLSPPPASLQRAAAASQPQRAARAPLSIQDAGKLLIRGRRPSGHPVLLQSCTALCRPALG